MSLESLCHVSVQTEKNLSDIYEMGIEVIEISALPVFEMEQFLELSEGILIDML